MSAPREYDRLEASPFRLDWREAAVVSIVSAIGDRWPSDWVTRGVLHLACMREPWATYIEDGSKRVESRWGAVKCAPHDQIRAGDIIAWKRSGGPVYGASIVSGALTLPIRDNSHAFDLLNAHADAIRVDPCGYDVNGKRWLTLIDLAGFLPFPKPPEVRKRGQSGWDVLQTRGGLFDV